MWRSARRRERPHSGSATTTPTGARLTGTSRAARGRVTTPCAFNCKVDIEGSDHLCLDALSRDHRPPFISVEVGFEAMLERLADLGYDRFKVIDQARFSTGSAWFYRSKAALTAAPCQVGLERLNSALRARSHDGEWKFRLGSSGALPDRTRGRWVSLRRAQRLIELLASQHRRGILGLTSWFDLHATDRATLSSAVR